MLVGLALCGCRTDRDAGVDDASHAGQPHPDTQATTKPASSPASDRTASLSAEDKKFVEKAAIGGLFEVESSKLALEKTESRKLREFAEMMVADHGDANRKLSDLARRKGTSVPSSLDSDHKRMMDELRDQNGKEFDARYHEQQVKAHDGAIKLFESAARNCDDADLRDLASKTLPVLRKHREMLDEKMEGG
jgi:putative membrane protein